MIERAVSNVDSKLSTRKQKVKVYSSNASSNQYYMNNIIGELGELVFAKAIVSNGYRLGVDSNSFGPFKRSDTCDFFGSKTALTIDVKTTHNKRFDNLLVNKKISDWRRIHSYVLVKLISKESLNNMDSIYSLKEAEVLGSVPFSKVREPSNQVIMNNRRVYLVNREKLAPIEKLIDKHFYKQDEKVKKYYSEGTLRLDIASIENGAVIECKDNKDINDRAADYRSMGEQDGQVNFTPVFFSSSNCVSFAIYKGEFNTSLFLKALLEAEVKARKFKHTLVIPDYIEDYIPENDKEELIKIIDRLKCNVEYVWSHNGEYGYVQ